MKKPAILCVDDEVNILEGLQDNLRKQFKVHTALSGAEGLALIESQGPFPVVISDMRMPEMNGAEFLSKVRAVSPDSMRILLTGQSDMSSAISAVNEGQIFRFLTKPCPTEHLSSIIDLALEHHRLSGLEKDLLENTLQGCVEALVEVLQLTNPEAFSRTNRLKEYVGHIAKSLNLPDRWQFEVAALLSQVGFVTLPAETLKKLFTSQPLDADEQALVDEHPAVAYRLISKIPRLENVASMILQQQAFIQKPDESIEFADGSGLEASEKIPADTEEDTAALVDEGAADDTVVTEEDEIAKTIAMGAKMLHVAMEYDVQRGLALTHSKAISTIRSTHGSDMTPLIDTLTNLKLARDNAAAIFKMANSEDLRRGMVLDQEVTDINGILLMASGQVVTDTVIQRLNVFAKREALNQPFRVRMAA